MRIQRYSPLLGIEDTHRDANSILAGPQRYYGGMCLRREIGTIFVSRVEARIERAPPLNLVEAHAQDSFGGRVGGNDSGFRVIVDDSLGHSFE